MTRHEHSFLVDVEVVDGRPVRAWISDTDDHPKHVYDPENDRAIPNTELWDQDLVATGWLADALKFGPLLLGRLRDQHDELTIDGFDDEGYLPGSGADHAALYYSLLELAGLRTQGCPPGEHVGPIVMLASEPIDGGIGLTVKCEACGQEADTSVDLDELEW